MKKLLFILIILLIAGCRQPTSMDLSQKLLDQKSRLQELTILVQEGLKTEEEGLHFTTEQSALFNQLLEQLDIRYAKYQDGCYIQLSKYRSENSGIGIDRGFAYRCNTPAHLVDDIDAMPTPSPEDFNFPADYEDPEGDTVVYQHVTENWYLFVEYYPLATD